MTIDDVIFLGVKSQVAAISKNDGRILWATSLGGGLGDAFVTLNCDGARIYAHAKGKLHCLDVLSGDILWTNELAGFGYGLASICVPGVGSAPDPAVYEKMEEDRRSSDSSAT